jgi:hypothetical protein
MLDSVETGLPVLEAQDLTPANFKAMIDRHSCVLVRGLFDAETCERLRAVAAETYRRYDLGVGRPLTVPDCVKSGYVSEQGMANDGQPLARFRKFGSLSLGMCPMALAVISAVLSRSKVKDCVEGYFGQPIGLSLNSSSIRLSEIDNPVRRVFHQDGAFLGGQDAETLNCWIALDPCGESAPGLEVFPQAIDELLAFDKPGAYVSWEIDDALVYERMGAEKAWYPTFQPGDAFLFNHLHVHRTYLTPEMKENRFAVESWMFPIKERYRDEMLAWLG